MKKKVVLALGIVLILCLGIGGKLYMDRKEEEKLIETERESIIVIKNTFSDIKKIEIQKTGYNATTVSYRMFVKMTNTNGETVEFSYSFWKETQELVSYVLKKEYVQKKGKTTEKVAVTFSNGSQEEL